jgi:hypothetical protein
MSLNINLLSHIHSHSSHNYASHSSHNYASHSSHNYTSHSQRSPPQLQPRQLSSQTLWYKRSACTRFKTSNAIQIQMRLLKLDDSGRLSLTGPFHRDIPEYAILSHTWAPDGEEHEVTYEDMVKDAGKDKPGYDKLQFCAKQALKHGLRYSWVDTCCINKSSSSELDEAIRSMFRWYSAAARCYVYLSDVPDLQDPTAESAFATSRWFTRGWTLQELVAPKKVEFFSRNGESLGYKESRVQQIHEITGIAIGALQGKPVSQFSIADRMSWAARRQTTREEDAAYCLLGILGMSMSPHRTYLTRS